MNYIILQGDALELLRTLPPESVHGSPRLLFPSEDAVREYQEREELKEWVRVAAGWDKIGRYTLEQLRAVKKILEG